MSKGEQRSNREKKKPKKDKAAKHQSSYASEYGKHHSRAISRNPDPARSSSAPHAPLNTTPWTTAA